MYPVDLSRGERVIVFLAMRVLMQACPLPTTLTHMHLMRSALQVIHRALELGINHLDTSDAYGPHTNEKACR